MDAPYTTLSMGDDTKFKPGGEVETVVTTSFMVGKLGPFRVTVPKTPTWSSDLRAAIMQAVSDVNQVKS